GDTDRVKSLDSSFHEAVYKASESNPLRQILSQLHNYIQSSRGLSIDSEGRAAAAVAEHRKIFEAIESGNGDLAEIEAQTHIINAKQSLLRVKNNK
ncbi:MAG: FCD domain-containing protein, partial [Clostridia bacterium]|nr:FCD domain-containing protein [Clostridia bacterium]